MKNSPRILQLMGEERETGVPGPGVDFRVRLELGEGGMSPRRHNGRGGLMEHDSPVTDGGDYSMECKTVVARNPNSRGSRHTPWKERTWQAWTRPSHSLPAINHPPRGTSARADRASPRVVGRGSVGDSSLSLRAFLFFAVFLASPGLKMC